MTDLVSVLDALDRLAVSAREAAPEESGDSLQRLALELRARRSIHGATLLVALAGGTGVGKSSLLNAVSGSELSSVSVLRPHTDRPLAWIPSSAGPALDDLLAGMEIADRVEQEPDRGFGLIDLPDIDSVAEGHRRAVERLIPRIDGVVWVLDPVKYRDPTLHDRFLGPLADYAEHFTFVLNKIDLVGANGRDDVVADVNRVLAERGYEGRPLVVTAAAPSIGAPEGIEELTGRLIAQASSKRLAVGKWLVDVHRALRSFGEGAGLWDGASVDFRIRWDRTRAAVADHLSPESGPGARAEAVCRLEDLVAMIAAEVGPPAGPSILEHFPDGAVAAIVEGAAAQVADHPGENADGHRARTLRVLDEAIAGPISVPLERRARLGAVLAEAVLATREALRDQDGAVPDVDAAGEKVSAGAR